ncbi:hypothetical protein LINPERHAP1_LOCUS28665 [Linum perenne]
MLLSWLGSLMKRTTNVPPLAALGRFMIIILRLRDGPRISTRKIR